MLLGKVIIKGTIETITGLSIGGISEGIKIGGVDLNVVTTPDGIPYIPGSSLKGKMRNLIERKLKLITDGNIHQCKDDNNYQNCPVCKIWGISPTDKDISISEPIYTRGIFRDVPLDVNSYPEDKRANEEWTEIKVENKIDRMKGSAKDPRHIERVPAGAEFSPMEIIYNVFDENDKDLLKYLFIAMELLETDYLGGSGSRGYGKVKFKNLKIYWNSKEDYERGSLNQEVIYEGDNIPEIVKNFEEIKGKIK